MRVSLAFLILAAAARLSAHAADWPQLQKGPQRLGCSPEKIDVPLQRAWAVGMSPERLHPQAQPVIADGRLFIGTAMGSFHAFEAKTGKKLWTFKAGGPILHTADGSLMEAASPPDAAGARTQRSQRLARRGCASGKLSRERLTTRTNQ